MHRLALLMLLFASDPFPNGLPNEGASFGASSHPAADTDDGLFHLFPLTGFAYTEGSGADVDDMTLTRAGARTCKKSAGALVSVATDKPCAVNDTSASGSPLVLLVDLARTNSNTRSSEIDSANWTAVNVTGGINEITAPDGTATGDRMIDTLDGVPSLHGIYQSVDLGSAQPAVMSVYGKPGTLSWVYLIATNLDVGCYFNLSTGAVGTCTANATAFVEPASGGFYRISVRIAAAVVEGTTGVGVFIANANEGVLYTGAGTGSVSLWGIQTDLNKLYPSPYVATAGATASAAGDKASATVHEIEADASAFCLALSARPRFGVWNDGLARYLLFYNSTASGGEDTELRLVVETDGKIYIDLWDGSVDRLFAAPSALTSGEHRIVVTYAPNNPTLKIDGASQVLTPTLGGTGVLDVQADAPLFIGSSPSATFQFGGSIWDIQAGPSGCS